jgi:hypothetical protein
MGLSSAFTPSSQPRRPYCASGFVLDDNPEKFVREFKQVGFIVPAPFAQPDDEADASDEDESNRHRRLYQDR